MKKVKQLSAWCIIGTMLLSPLSTFATVRGVTNESKTAKKINQALEVGTTYYIDATAGDDTNLGTSPEEAWSSLEKASSTVFEAGDQILFKSGEIWQGSFAPKGSGAKGAPIVVNSYTYENGVVTIGEGEKPVINGAGEVLYAVELYNVEFWELHNLEVTNLGAERESGRTGVMIHADNDFNTTEDSYIEHIYVKDLYVHDVNGDLTRKDYNNGGIFYRINADTNPLTYKDIRIEDNYVKDVSRTGISFGSTASYEEIRGKALNQSTDEELRMALHHDVEIRNNYVERVGGDAIVPQYCYEGLIEYNVSQEASVNTIGNPNLMYSAGIWGWQCFNTLYQYNEAYGTYLNGDGQGYDCDWGWGTTYQYNYSHDNEGGFMLICFSESIDSVVRYNISQNDKRSLFMTSNRVPATVYNNTFYLDDSVSNTQMFAPYNGAANFYNNIFYNAGTPRSTNWERGNVSYDNNLYYGFTNTPSDSNKIIADPMFVDPGKGATGTLQSGPALESLHGYELQATSPAINAGMHIAADKLPSIVNPITKDFYGNETGTFTVDLGAIDTQTMDLRLHSKIYDVNHNEKTVNGLRANTTIDEFKQNITVEPNAVVTLYKESQEVASGLVEEGMSVEVSLGGQTVAYTIGEFFRDQIAPQIIGVKDVTIIKDSEFDPMAGISATDNEDGEITERIQVAGTVDTQKLGNYTLVYTVADRTGNETSESREVKVVSEDSYLRLYDKAIINAQGPSIFWQYRQNNTIGDMILIENAYWKHPNNWASASKRSDNNKLEVAAANGTDGIITYAVPKAGEITITDDVFLGFPQESSGRVDYRIELNGEKVWPLDTEWAAVRGTNPVKVENLTLNVVEGDKIGFVAHFADHNRPAVFIDPIISYTEQIPEPNEDPTMNLTGNTEVNAREEVTVTVNLANVQNIYAQDLTLTFDSNLFTFKNLEARATNEKILHEVTGNNVRVLLAATQGAINGEAEILSLTFDTLDIEGTQIGTIQIASAQLGSVVDGVSTIHEMQANPLSVTVKGKDPIVTLPGDANEDGKYDIADLALAAYYYYAVENGDNWTEAGKADTNKDGVIDIKDLGFIANKILE